MGRGALFGSRLPIGSETARKLRRDLVGELCSVTQDNRTSSSLTGERNFASGTDVVRRSYSDSSSLVVGCINRSRCAMTSSSWPGWSPAWGSAAFRLSRFIVLASSRWVVVSAVGGCGRGRCWIFSRVSLLIWETGCGFLGLWTSGIDSKVFERLYLPIWGSLNASSQTFSSSRLTFRASSFQHWLAWFSFLEANSCSWVWLEGLFRDRTIR